jgi:hypothetical protein
MLLHVDTHLNIFTLETIVFSLHLLENFVVTHNNMNGFGGNDMQQSKPDRKTKLLDFAYI